MAGSGVPGTGWNRIKLMRQRMPLSRRAIESPLAEPTATTGAFESPVGVPNPASQFCEEQGYTLEIREGADGQIGVCLFPDGTECEEWAFYRGECAPGTPKP